MSNFLLKHSRSSTIWMKPMKYFFFLQFPSSIFLVVVLYPITNLFQDPKDPFFSLNLSTTQFKMWILSSFMPLLHQHMVYDTIPHPYKCRRESSVFFHIPTACCLLPHPALLHDILEIDMHAIVFLSLPSYQLLRRKSHSWSILPSHG